MNQFFEKGMQILNQATEADNKQDYETAFQKYSLSIEYFLTGLKYSKNQTLNRSIQGKIKEFLDRAEKIKTYMAQNSGKAQGANATSKDSSQKESGEGPKLDEETRKLRASLEDTILKEKPTVKWSDVAGLEQAKTALEEAVILPLKFPQMFTGKRKPWKGILLYGPPGTGKSLLAKATASMTDSMFFSVSSSNLVSKWQGESEKLIRELFRMAMESKPAIIFIDEIDAICGKRGDDEQDATRRIKTEFLVQMQKILDSEGVLVLGATNRPFDLDAAVRRRFEKRIYIPLPDAPARRAMFGIHAGKDIKIDPDLLDELVNSKETEGYSGSDLSILVRDVLMQPIRESMKATHWKRVARPPYIKSGPETMMTPCNPNDMGAVAMNMLQVNSEELLIPQIGSKHWLLALERNKPSVNQKELKMQEDFTRQFGLHGITSATVMDHQPADKEHDTSHGGKIQIIKSSGNSTPASPNVLPPNFRLPQRSIMSPEQEDHMHNTFMEFTHNTTERIQSENSQKKDQTDNNNNNKPQFA